MSNIKFVKGNVVDALLRGEIDFWFGDESVN